MYATTVTLLLLAYVTAYPSAEEHQWECYHGKSFGGVILQWELHSRFACTSDIQWVQGRYHASQGVNQLSSSTGQQWCMTIITTDIVCWLRRALDACDASWLRHCYHLVRPAVLHVNMTYLVKIATT